MTHSESKAVRPLAVSVSSSMHELTLVLYRRLYVLVIVFASQLCNSERSTLTASLIIGVKK